MVSSVASRLIKQISTGTQLSKNFWASSELQGRKSAIPWFFRSPSTVSSVWKNQSCSKVDGRVVCWQLLQICSIYLVFLPAAAQSRPGRHEAVAAAQRHSLWLWIYFSSTVSWTELWNNHERLPKRTHSGFAFSAIKAQIGFWKPRECLLAVLWTPTRIHPTMILQCGPLQLHIFKSSPSRLCFCI